MESGSPNGQASSRKRARTETNAYLNHETEASNALQDPEFWAEDGTVILMAERSKFRVYRGVLAEHSPLFAEMFSLPQADESAAPGHASCPIVRLQENAENVRVLLRLLLPRKTSNFACNTSPTFDTISAYVRMAHKYQMDSILDQWMDYLQDHFTTDCEQWIERGTLVPPGFRPVHAIGVVNLARLTGRTSILPTALAVCTTLEEKIVDGFVRADGVREQLSMQDLGRCFKAKTAIIQSNVAATLAVLDADTDKFCDHPLSCQAGINALSEVYDQTAIADYANSELAPSWTNNIGSAVENLTICRTCCSGLRRTYIDEQRKLWKRLPRLFGLQIEGWKY